MSKWMKYKRSGDRPASQKSQVSLSNVVGNERLQKQFETALDIWAFSQPNSLIRLAKLFREWGNLHESPISFEESIEMAKEYAQGRLK